MKNNSETHKGQDGKFVGEFQDIVEELLVRHKSILDCLTKYQEATARVNRAITKTVTMCGCVSINAGAQEFPVDESIKEFGKHVSTHLEGKLCESCTEIIEEEIGNHLFYLAALCNLLNIDLREVLNKEYSRLNTLGHFFLS